MMDYVGITKRAWQTLWRYRALWVWGIVLALSATSWSAWTMADLGDIRERDWQGVSITVGDNETFRQAWRRTWSAEIDEANRAVEEVLAELLHVEAKVNVVALFVALLGLVLTLTIVGRVARYVSEAALVRMVDRYQETGERKSVWEGLRMGWSRSAWQLFLIHVLVDVAGVGAAVLLFGLLFAPLPLWVHRGSAVILMFSFLTAGFFFGAIVAVILWGVVLSVLKRLAWRACALEGLGVLASIRRASRLLAQQFKHAGGAWLITAGVRWGWRAAMVPAALALLGLGLLSGSLPALLIGGAAGRYAGNATAVTLALAVGIPLFLLVLVGPLVLLAGLREVFLSTVWTLSYRKLSTLQRPVPARATVSGTSGLETAPVTS